MAKNLTLRTINELRDSVQRIEGLPTLSSEEQYATEELCAAKYEDLHKNILVNKNLPLLLRKQHIDFLLQNLSYLPSSYQILDASRSWMCYWILHALSLLGTDVNKELKTKIISFLRKCQHPDGGFGGGPGQLSHLAPTYAAVNALVLLGTEEAYKVIDRVKLKEYLLRMHQPNGAFTMHHGGEEDIRGAYCALSVASLTGILSDDIFKNTAEWIVSCQTYEGGFAGCPGMEAHGGYSFCGLAALILLQKGHLMDKNSFLRWLVNRQMKFEGGFQGRTNKLVDGCYSFWQGGAFYLIYSLLAYDDNSPKSHLFDERALQEYLLICCQNVHGGLLDKPGKPRDLYHTCYTLSGLSVAQHFQKECLILGPLQNEVALIHPLYNVRPDLVKKAILYFNSLITCTDSEGLNTT
ncbi:protein farnesyltransferase subunit beta [Aethina tumida]|uniref:protein farnesyltransferase subunit beta n=1 Tax=Aethina tumida TaxID=116153 RepID=UPI002147A359|nr:protein farnesyltransferase subunit beta [Aethina tumida]